MSKRVRTGKGSVHAGRAGSARNTRVRRAEQSLQRYVPAVVSACGLAMFVATAGCVREYRPPKAGEPHAVVKLRRSYERTDGVSLRETIDIDEHRAFDQTSASRLAAEPRTDAILVHPVAATASVATGFFHTEMQTVQERYSQQVPEHYTESYSCGSGTSYRTCTRSATRYRTEWRTRWVTKQVEVSDGACERELAFTPQVGRVYLLQYTYQDRGVCTLSCFEQEPGAPGTFSSRLCAAAPAK
jgi:hypothetical protein